MRFERLVIAAGSNLFTLDFHPRLTVVCGVSQLERDVLVGELIGALGSGRPGVHLELVDDRARRLALFRPIGGRHRVVDVDRASDLSARFATAEGGVDMLAGEGLDIRRARRLLRLNADDLAMTSQGGQLIRQLAQMDQATLWAAADGFRAADEALQGEAAATGSLPEDAAVVERIEERHRDFERAKAGREAARERAIRVGAGCAVAAIPVTLYEVTAALLPLLVTCLALWLSVRARRRLDLAEQEEQAALADAGVGSYLGFQLQRVSGLLSSTQSRHRLLTAADAHRAALVRWHEAAGDVQVEWALEHREEIQAAAQLQRDMSTLGTLSSTAPELDGDVTTDLARALVGRLTELRHAGTSGESYPLLLDDPFVDLASSVKPSLLELLGRAAGSPQVVFFTDDEDVVSWARLEALTGELTLVEPHPERADQGQDSRHLVQR